MHNSQFIIVAVAAVLMLAGCRTHKQTQTLSQTETSGQLAIQDSAASVRVIHAASDIRTLLAHQADSVVATIEADSVIAPDGTRICNARIRAALHRPSAAMERTELNAVADSAASAAGTSVMAAHHCSGAATMQQNEKTAPIFTQTDIYFLCFLIVAGIVTIGFFVYKTMRLK